MTRPRFLTEIEARELDRRSRNRWLVAGAIVIWLAGFLIGIFLGG